MPFTPVKEVHDTFPFQSETSVIGSSDPRYPYPATENWQKAIGGHMIWLEGDAAVIFNGDLRTAAGNASIGRSGRTDRPRDRRRG